MIETQEYKNFQGFTGDSHKVGVSKPLSELTPDDIINYDKYLCGEINKYVNVTYFGKIPQISLPEDDDNKPMFSTNVSWNDTFWCSQPPKKDLYMRTLLLNVPNNKRDREYTFTVLDNNVRIVTELTDFQDMYITTKIGKIDDVPYATKTDAGTVETGRVSGIVKNVLTDTSYIIPVWVITDGTNLWITSGVIYHSYYVNFNNNLTNQGFNSGIVDFNNNKDNSLSFGINPNTNSEPVKCTDIIPNNETAHTIDVNGKTFGIMITYGASNYQPRGKFWFNNNIDENTTPFGENNQFIDITAYYGMYMRSVIKNNNEYVWYKPIISGGMVTGYSTDMNAKSDIDEWEILENHNIPIIQPNTNNDEDDIESVGYGYFSNAVMGTLYSLYNKLDLEKIAQWFYNQTEKIDIANNVISLKEIPFSLSTLNIVPLETDLKIGGVNVTYNNENIKVGQIISPATTSVSVLFGEFNIPRLSGTFLDYSPYTKYELLLPFAPTPITLPDWCVNKTVKAIFLYDIYTTSCQYVIECNGERICSVSGIFGVDRPISAQNVALKDASRLSAQVATASSVLGGVMSASTGNISGIMSGAIGGVSALSQMIMSGKQNYMYTVGANGDSSSVGLCHAVHLKITRTLSAEDNNFTHVYGRPLCKYKKLSSVTGYTKCDNVNTTSLTCSETEKQRIKQLLETGIYI